MKEKKLTVGLMTLSNVINFGSALQTYATVKVVEKFGLHCEVIDYEYPSRWHSENSSGCENTTVISSCWLKKYIKAILNKLGLLEIIVALRYRTIKLTRVFRNFLHQRISLTPIKYNRESILKKIPEFDIYMTGSDQTWNPRYLHTDYSFLLNFAPENSPKIAYAASFGATEMLPDYRESYSKYLQKYDYISVREKTGIPLVAELTGKKAWHTPDPTLMLHKEEWLELTQRKLKLPEKYIFAYVLDYVFNPYPYIIDLLNHLSKISNMPVVFFGVKVAALGGNYEYIDQTVGPEGFIECFAKASFVVTTSFHGSAFSVNFEKDFFVVLNHASSIDDRVKTFLDSVGLAERGLILPQTDIHSITLEDMKTEHSVSRRLLQEMRDSSMDYLREALEFAKRKCNGDNPND